MANHRPVLVLDASDIQVNGLPSYSFVECKGQLMLDFDFINSCDIHIILTFSGGHYAKAHKCLRTIMDEMDQMKENGNDRAHAGIVSVMLKDGDETSGPFIIEVLQRRRYCGTENTCSDELQREVTRVKEELRVKDEETGRRFAFDLLYKEYENTGQLIECACCFGNSVFDTMVQCTDGHLVCLECMKGYITEIAFGNLKVDLRCLMSDCTAQYSHSELERCIDSVTLSRLDERAFEENLNSAKLENLVRCPYCNFACIVEDRPMKFICQRDSCKKAICLYCGADWKDHEGLPCSQVDRDETALRKEYEEKMTKAAVRTCPNCSAQFTKELGCNLMWCRCGSSMCYLCFAPQVDYTHFCEHGILNEAKNKCLSCGHCPLFTDWVADEEAAIHELQREAREKRKALGFDEDKDIGVPPPAKKVKV